MVLVVVVVAMMVVVVVVWVAAMVVVIVMVVVMVVNGSPSVTNYSLSPFLQLGHATQSELTPFLMPLPIHFYGESLRV